MSRLQLQVKLTLISTDEVEVKVKALLFVQLNSILNGLVLIFLEISKLAFTTII